MIDMVLTQYGLFDGDADGGRGRDEDTALYEVWMGFYLVEQQCDIRPPWSSRKQYPATESLVFIIRGENLPFTSFFLRQERNHSCWTSPHHVC